MPQGNLKVKTSVPKLANKKVKGGGITKRKNKPALPKIDPKSKIQKINKQITKNVNAALEKEIRNIATEGQKVHLSKKKTAATTKK